MSQTAPPGSQRMLAGRYAVSELLGQGGMSTVYKGTDVKLGRTVAIKIMRANLADDETFRLRFRQEAQSASRLAHPGVVRVLDAGDDLIQSANGPQRLPFIVMEYVDGQDLRAMLANDTLSIEESTRVVEAVLGALEYSHRAGIVHRDIKPANIMVTSTGQVKVMDFGIARAVSDTTSNLQQTTAVLGTAAYFSPEQAKGELIDTRTDLYSAGVLLYELLAGQLPFTGDTAVAVAYQHVSERPKPPSQHNPDISPELERVVLHALAKDRTRRFQTATEFKEALRLAASGVMPQLDEDEDHASVLFHSEEQLSDSELALRRLAESGGLARSQSRPPVMWVWAAILAIAGVIIAVVFWVLTLVPQSFVPEISKEVPDLVGIEQSAAVEQLLELGLTPNVQQTPDDDIEAGSVARTDPSAGAMLSIESEVTVYVSTGSDNPKVPDFAGMNIAEYTEALKKAGLEVGSVSSEDKVGEDKDQVLSTSTPPGDRLPRGSSVNVTVASGLVLIPDVRGLALEVAKSTVSAMGQPVPFPLNNCARQPGFPIVEQSLVGQQPPGSQILLSYCQGN